MGFLRCCLHVIELMLDEETCSKYTMIWPHPLGGGYSLMVVCPEMNYAEYLGELLILVEIRNRHTYQSDSRDPQF